MLRCGERVLIRQPLLTTTLGPDTTTCLEVAPTRVSHSLNCIEGAESSCAGDHRSKSLLKNPLLSDLRLYFWSRWAWTRCWLWCQEKEQDLRRPARLACWAHRSAWMPTAPCYLKQGTSPDMQELLWACSHPSNCNSRDHSSCASW